MILQALTEYYQSLVQAEKIAAPGWKSSDISFVLCISDEGELEQVISIKNQVSQGKKTVLRPQSMILPVPADGRTSTAVRPNFLWDKSDYLLGISKGGTQRGIKYFNGAKEYHEAILSGVVSPAATALLAFFQQWNPEKAPEHGTASSTRRKVKSHRESTSRWPLPILYTPLNKMIPTP